MKISLLTVITAALTLAGCTTLPKSLDDAKPVSAAEIFQAVACEFVVAASTQESLNNTSAGIDLTLNKTKNVILAPSAGWTAAYSGVEVSGSPTGKVDSKYENNLQVRHSLGFVRTDAHRECLGDPSAYSSGLGLAAELERQMILIEGLDPRDAISDMSITRTFTVNRTVGGNLKFVVAGVTVQFEGSQASRDDTHTIKIILERADDPADAGRAQDNINKRLDQDDRDQRLVEFFNDATGNGAPL
jgi:hypothetical protein